jgi:squalene-hopene/tetraprenyl-beta-curcumene cyclase
MALSVMGHPNSHPIIRKALNALKSFRQLYLGNELPADANSCVIASPEVAKQSPAHSATIHQQCCISPVWDTPWQITALLESGVSPDDPRLLKAGRWLISKQVTHAYGDWKFKNNNVEPGGWSFEFENDFFPDVDDTIQVLHVLKRLAIPDGEKSESISRGLKWLVSMQNDDGGWAAFDRNNRRELVNKIPFSDHGACLDPSTPDVTARAVALLSEFIQIPSPIKNVIPAKAGIHSAISRGLDYLSSTQEDFGGWFGRWGVNYIYGTWCVLTALSKVAQVPSGWNARISKAAGWLMSIQHADGGFSESPESYKTNKYLPYPRPDKADKGVPSQTAWALMGLMAARLCHCESAKADEAISRGTEFLIKNLRNDGTWDEKEFTGTGFPNHFYIRYHGYRHFFPLLALGKLYHSQVLVIPAQAGI